MFNGKRFFAVLLIILAGAYQLPADDGPSKAAQLEFFETRIRPILVERCYACHNSTKTAEASLALDHRAGLLKGGDRGAIIVPGQSGKSRLLRILRHELPGLEMPQDDGKLSNAVIADIAQWIDMGAPDPRDKPPTLQELTRATSWESIFEKRKAWWSFQPVVKPSVPAVRAHGWSPHVVDRFLLAAMERRGLAPAAEADRRSLLRRATFVLTGLPPTSAEIEAFLADSSPAAFHTVVDRLLESPRFGERWARHWMDLVRYCESHGSQGDPELANAFRYRDYLIRAFNSDIPYDQLVREHLAGDLLPQPRWNRDENFNESAIGPAHLRMVELGFVPVDALEDQVKVVDNQIDVYSKAFLGLTASCARCHNHKFDPISQEDFYALYGIFVSSRPGQVLIDSPELLDRNRRELTQLKQQIRSGLVTAWLEAAERLSTRLKQETDRQSRIAILTERQTKLRAAIETINSAARAIVLRKRGRDVRGALPAPNARWSFDGHAQDGVGTHHGKLLGGAVVRDGRLILDGVAANMRTAPLSRDIHEKTLEAWVALANLKQRGGGVIGLDTPNGRFFDSIVFGELNPQHWMAGSDFFRRSQDPGGARESVPPSELVHVAIVYAKDNAITVYRNGKPYGATYRKGTLQPFLKGQSRFLFGQRLSDVNPPLAGEIDEARAYFRALTADEVAASFRAGPEGVTDEELEAVLTAEQRARRAVMQADDQRLHKQLAELQPESQALWMAALDDAQANKGNPLYPWRHFATDAQPQSSTIPADRWSQLTQFWQSELQTRREFNQAQFKTLWDLDGQQHQDWFAYGTGFVHDNAGQAKPLTAPARGPFFIEPEGQRVVRGIHEAGLYTHQLSSRHTGVLTSPRFMIRTNSISVRALGKSSRVRLVIENYPIGNGGIYPAARLDRDTLGWIRLDTAYRKGAHAYFEFTTDPIERAHFGAAQMVTSDQNATPRETSIPIMSLLHGDAPKTTDALATRYAQCLKRAITAWQSRTVSPDDTALLDFFVRRGLLPTTLSELPQLRDLIQQYRRLEGSIPVPRRAPGVLETVAFDQPLFERGQHTRPTRPVPRRGLSLLGTIPFDTPQSGRLQLAEQTASPRNPLVARVMVNRLWQHVFGQGIVATVDNFGHLGTPATHPQLLDYLAATFIEQNWSVKKMLRLLITSRAFQQSSVESPRAARTDPNNALLSHMSVKRLDAEAIRDSLLAASGQLDLKMFGPGVNVYYTKKTEGGGPKGPLDGNRRRSVYLRIRRNAHNPFLEVFDAPKPTSTRGTRDATNVPAQSLTMLNDPFVIDQATKWSQQLMTLKRNPRQRIRFMFRRAFGREPSSAELRSTQDYVADLTKEHADSEDEKVRQERVWRDVAHALFCLKEFIYVQ